MTRDELYSELHGLADSIDDHITEPDVTTALADLRTRIQTEGLTD